MADSKLAKSPKLQPDFVKGLLTELKKVTWPTKRQTIRLTGVVIVISLIVAVYVGIIDLLLAKILEALTQRA